MSTLADLAQRSAKHVGTALIATLDIERLPGRAKVSHRGRSIEGDFWDLGGWRDLIHRRIDPDEVTDWPRTICLAWRWAGTRKVEFAAEWQDGGREAMLLAAHDVYDRADLIQGHNAAAFDTKKLKGEWALLHLRPPSPFKVYDTLKVARTELGMDSNKLDSLNKRFGIRAKTDKYSIAVARAACEGDEKMQRRLQRYNVGDISASEGLADFLRPWAKTHPHVGAPTDKLTCNRCGSAKLELQAKRYRAVVLDYAMYRCLNCGGHVRAGHVARAASTRGV